MDSALNILGQRLPHTEVTNTLFQTAVLSLSFAALAQIVNWLGLTIGLEDLLRCRSMDVPVFADEFAEVRLTRPSYGSRRSSRMYDLEFAMDEDPEPTVFVTSLPTHDELYKSTSFQYAPQKPVSRVASKKVGGALTELKKPVCVRIGSALRDSVSFMDVFWSTAIGIFCVLAIGG